MNAQEKIDKLIAIIEAGATVIVVTPLRHTVVTGKTLKKFQAANLPFFKATKDSMMMREGPRYVSIDYCQFFMQ